MFGRSHAEQDPDKETNRHGPAWSPPVAERGNGAGHTADEMWYESSREEGHSFSERTMGSQCSSPVLRMD